MLATLAAGPLEAPVSRVFRRLSSPPDPYSLTRRRHAPALILAVILALCLGSTGAVQSAPAAPPTPGPVAYLPLNDNQGTKAHNQVPHGRFALLMGGAGWTAGIHGSAVSLDGKEQYVEFSRPVVDTTGSFTVSAWVKLNSLDGWQTILSQGGDFFNGFALQKRGDNNHLGFTMYAADDGMALPQAADSGFVPVLGRWYQVTGVCDRPAGQIRLYVDGARVAAVPFTGAWQATGKTEIGRGTRFGDPESEFLNGAVEDVLIYSRALGDAEISELGNRQ